MRAPSPTQSKEKFDDKQNAKSQKRTIAPRVMSESGGRDALRSALLVTFPADCFEDSATGSVSACYSYACACLAEACRSSHVVFVCLRFREPAVAYAELQQTLFHIYGTLAQESSPDCAVVVVDPSVGLTRVLKEEPWASRIAEASRCVEREGKRVRQWPHPPPEYAQQFPHGCESVSVVPRFRHGVNGGTFDRLHNGHRVLLSASAAVCSESLTVGITSDAMIAQSSKSLKELVEPFETRREAVATFLHFCNPGLRQVLASIDDAFGPSIVDPQLEVIIVSEESVRGGEAVNEKRAVAKLSRLEVAQIDCWDRHSKSKGSIETKISSTDARKKAKRASL